MNINGTCYTPDGWACRGRWGCPKTFKSPWDQSRSFFSKIVHETYFKFSFLVKDSATCPAPGGWLWRCVVEVLGVEIMTWKIFLQLDFVYGWWHAKIHWPSSKLKPKRNPPRKATEKSPQISEVPSPLFSDCERTNTALFFWSNEQCILSVLIPEISTILSTSG